MAPGRYRTGAAGESIRGPSPRSRREWPWSPPRSAACVPCGSAAMTRRSRQSCGLSSRTQSLNPRRHRASQPPHRSSRTWRRPATTRGGHPATRRPRHCLQAPRLGSVAPHPRRRDAPPTGRSRRRLALPARPERSAPPAPGIRSRWWFRVSRRGLGRVTAWLTPTASPGSGSSSTRRRAKARAPP